MMNLKASFEFNITEDGGLYFGTSNNQNDELNTAQETNSFLISAGNWHHVAVTFDNGYLFLCRWPICPGT